MEGVRGGGLVPPAGGTRRSAGLNDGGMRKKHSWHSSHLVNQMGRVILARCELYNHGTRRTGKPCGIGGQSFGASGG